MAPNPNSSVPIVFFLVGWIVIISHTEPSVDNDLAQEIGRMPPEEKQHLLEMLKTWKKQPP